MFLFIEKANNNVFNIWELLLLCGNNNIIISKDIFVNFAYSGGERIEIRLFSARTITSDNLIKEVEINNIFPNSVITDNGVFLKIK